MLLHRCHGDGIIIIITTLFFVYLNPVTCGQKGHRCLFTQLLTHFPIPDRYRLHVQQPTSYHTVLVGHPSLLPPKSRRKKMNKRKENKGKKQRKNTF